MFGALGTIETDTCTYIRKRATEEENDRSQDRAKRTDGSSTQETLRGTLKINLKKFEEDEHVVLEKGCFTAVATLSLVIL